MHIWFSVVDQINILNIGEPIDALSLRRELNRALTRKTIPFIDSWISGVYNGDRSRWKQLLDANVRPRSGVTGVIISAMAIFLGKSLTTGSSIMMVRK